jgi:myosin-1
VNKQLSIQAERTIPLGAIKYVGTSTLNDDWFSLGVSSPQEPDPLISCILKTEFFTCLQSAIPGGLNLKMADSIEYNKKPGKPAMVKVVKDPAVGLNDLYKSGTIHTGPGQPPNSVSRPTPKPKAVAAKPITSGKLLRKGGPGGQAGKLSSAARNQGSRSVPQSRPVPGATSTLTSRPIPQPVAALSNGHSRNDSASSFSSGRAVPPPPPPAPPPQAAPTPREPTYRALYDFDGQSQNELTMKKGDVIIVVQKESNGKLKS